MQRGCPMELNFEGLGMQKLNIPTDRAQRVDQKKWGHFSNYHTYSQIYGHQNVKNGSFLSFVLLTAKSKHSFGKIFKCT